MGGVKIPGIGGNIGSTDQVVGALANPFGTVGELGIAAATGGKNIGSVVSGNDINIKDPAGMNQYTDLANQAQQEYGRQRQFMQENVDPRRRQLLEQLGKSAEGTAPSIVENQLRSAFDKSLQQQLAAARSQRGGNAGLASRNLINSAAQQQQNLASQASLARLQEQNQAQQSLQQAVQNEQQYATGTLGSALGSQANVASMQNAQRDRNDARIGNLLGGAGQLAGSLFGGIGFADGGQVPSLESVLKTNLEKAPKKLAYGGQYQAGVGDTSEFERGAQLASKKAPSGSLAQSLGTATNIAKKINDKKVAAEDESALNEMVSEFEAAESAQKPALQTFVPRMPGPGQQVIPPGMLPISRVPAYSSGGSVEGKEEVKGDSFKNDKLIAALSAGEVVVPKSVIEAGPIASGYFVKKATEDASYNAKSFKAEKPTLARMLKEIQDSEETFNKVSQMLSSKKKVK